MLSEEREAEIRLWSKFLTEGMEVELLAEIDQLRADCNTLQASVAIYFRENEKLKALLREVESSLCWPEYRHEELRTRGFWKHLTHVTKSFTQIKRASTPLNE